MFVLVCGYTFLFGLVGYLAAKMPAPVSGAYFGGVSVGLLWAVWWFLSLDGAQFVRSGAWAEEWSSEALRRTQPDSVVSDDFPFDRGNLDHVVVGAGGVYAVETKWRTRWKGRTVDLKTLRVERAQATSQAEELQAILLSLGHAVIVRPVIVAWGPGIPTDEPAVQFGRVPIFVGHRWREWPGRPFDRDKLTAAQVAAISEALLSYVTEHSPNHQMSLRRRGSRIARALLLPTASS